MKKFFLLLWLFVYMFLFSSVTHAYVMGSFELGKADRIEKMVCCPEDEHVGDTKVMKNPCAPFLEMKGENLNMQVVNVLLPIPPFVFFTQALSFNIHDILSIPNAHSPPIFTTYIKNYNYAQLLGVIKKTI